MNNIQVSDSFLLNIARDIEIVGVNNFIFFKWRDINRSEILQYQNLVPFCIDFSGKRVLYVSDVDLPESLKAPFLYSYLRKHAQKIVAVPLDEIAIPVKPLPIEIPRFIFSPGRCGSTLLTKIANHGGSISLSEPDFYTQLLTLLLDQNVSAKERVKLELYLKRIAFLLTIDLVGTYQKSTRDPISIKLRSECCAFPERLIFNKAQNFIFLIRHFIPWAKSYVSHFGMDENFIIKEILPAIYQRAIDCYKTLKAKASVDLICYERMTELSQANVDQLSNALGVSISVEHLRGALAQDSQKGTALESKEYGLPDLKIVQIEEAYKIWLQNAPKDFLQENNLTYLSEYN